MLEEALAHSSPEQAELLRLHYLSWMPEQLAQTLTDQFPLFHQPLDPLAHPRLYTALCDWVAWGAEAGMSEAEMLPEGLSCLDEVWGLSLAQFYQRTAFGETMPMLMAWPHDLCAYQQESLEAQETLAEVLDKRLVAPLLHELAHFDRHHHPLHPTCLDECVAAWCGAKAHPAQAFAAPGLDVAIYGAPWFAQIGQILACVARPGQLLRAQAGLLPWEEALGERMVEALSVLGLDLWKCGQEPHFLSGHHRPQLWLAAIAWVLAHGKLSISAEELSSVSLSSLCFHIEDENMLAEVLHWGVRAMTLRASIVGGCHRVEAVPAQASWVIDWKACFQCAPEGTGHEPALRYVVPPTVAQRWLGRGIVRTQIRLHEEGALETLVAVLCAGSGAEDGFVLTHER